MTKLNGYNSCIDNKVSYTKVNEFVKNKDAVSTMNRIKEILKTDKSNLNNYSATDYYNEFIQAILQEGTPYSTFVEMLFANMLLSKIAKTGTKDVEFWRYNQDKPIAGKLGDKTMAGHLSKLLGLLFHPNKSTLSNISLIDELDDVEKIKNLSVYEKIWLGEFGNE